MVPFGSFIRFTYFFEAGDIFWNEDMSFGYANALFVGVYVEACAAEL